MEPSTTDPWQCQYMMCKRQVYMWGMVELWQLLGGTGELVRPLIFLKNLVSFLVRGGQTDINIWGHWLGWDMILKTSTKGGMVYKLGHVRGFFTLVADKSIQMFASYPESIKQTFKGETSGPGHILRLTAGIDPQNTKQGRNVFKIPKIKIAQNCPQFLPSTKKKLRNRLGKKLQSFLNNRIVWSCSKHDQEPSQAQSASGRAWTIRSGPRTQPRRKERHGTPERLP